MNKTGIAWVNKTGSMYTYQRIINSENIRITDSDIYRLHKKVISKNYVWGIRDKTKALKIIKKAPSSQENVTATFKRTNKDYFNVKIKGIINSKELNNIYNKLRFFEHDIKERHEKKINNKTKIQIEYNLKISVFEEFKRKINELEWKIIL